MAIRHHQLFRNLVQISVTIRYMKVWWGLILLALPTDCYIKDIHCDHQPVTLLLFKVFCSNASLQLRLLLLWEQPQCPSVSQSCVMSSSGISESVARFSVPGMRNRQGVGMSGGSQWLVTCMAGEANWKQRGTGKHMPVSYRMLPRMWLKDHHDQIHFISIGHTAEPILLN